MKNRSQKTSKIIRDISTYATQILKAKQEADMREAFKVLDQDASGEIDSEELKEIMSKISSGITDEQINELISLVDKDGSGSIDCDEFLVAMRSKSAGISKIIKQIKRYAKDIVDKKHDNDLSEAF